MNDLDTRLRQAGRILEEASDRRSTATESQAPAQIHTKPRRSMVVPILISSCVVVVAVAVVVAFATLGHDGSDGSAVRRNVAVEPPTLTPLPTTLPAYCGDKVSSRGGVVVGCTKATDDSLPPPQFDALTAPNHGEPVYDLDGNNQVVGYIGEIGFVPLSMASEYPQLKVCSDAYLAELQDATQPKLSDQCRQLLRAQGTPADRLSGY